MQSTTRLRPGRLHEAGVIVIAPTWDIFCTVVDNFGDVGVCWRLARQLAQEHNLAVRLWVDDLKSFQRLNKAIDPLLDSQTSCGVDVRRWARPFPDVMPADVVLETFGCELPESYLAAMAAKQHAPAWINLEYLSAETWVHGCHGLPSPHPRLPLTKYYFFPGFTADTGGLLREHGLDESRRAFQQNAAAQATFWRSLNMPAPAPEEQRVSLFCYENPALPDLLQTWASGEERLTCVIPEGAAAQGAAAFFGQHEKFAPQAWRRGNLVARIVPFLDQSDYDRLLWSCDCNFVRGEDSFVRALWAARPFAWHIYPQKENAHWVKLNAFLDYYGSNLPEAAAAALRGFCRAWVGGRGAGVVWPDFRRQWPTLATHARQWVAASRAAGDLASNLLKFSANLLK